MFEIFLITSANSSTGAEILEFLSWGTCKMLRKFNPLSVFMKSNELMGITVFLSTPQLIISHFPCRNSKENNIADLYAYSLKS